MMGGALAWSRPAHWWAIPMARTIDNKQERENLMIQRILLVIRRILPISLLAGGIALGLSACGTSGPKRSIDDPTNSLVFGYIDMDDAPTKISNATLEQLAPPSDTPYWPMGVLDGIFVNPYLPQGSYQLSQLGGSGFFAGEHLYSFPRQGNETTVKIARPGIYFLGSYKYREQKSGFFEAGKFSIDRVKSPTEKQLLTRILEESDEIRESPWGERIRARLKQLK